MREHSLVMEFAYAMLDFIDSTFELQSSAFLEVVLVNDLQKHLRPKVFETWL